MYKSLNLIHIWQGSFLNYCGQQLLISSTVKLFQFLFKIWEKYNIFVSLLTKKTVKLWIINYINNRVVHKSLIFIISIVYT